MADEIIQGDSGTVMQTTIRDDNGIVDIRGTNITFTILSPSGRIEKQGVVVNGEQGLCEFVLNSEDVKDIGNFAFQATIEFPNSNSTFSSDIKKFKVGRKL